MHDEYFKHLEEKEKHLKRTLFATILGLALSIVSGIAGFFILYYTIGGLPTAGVFLTAYSMTLGLRQTRYE